MIDHLGNLESFFEKYPQYVRHLEGQGKAIPSQAPVEKKAAVAEAPKISFEERKKYKNQAKSLQKKIEAAEAEIESLGQKKSAGDWSGDLEKRHNTLLAEWEKMSSELERIRQIVPDLLS